MGGQLITIVMQFIVRTVFISTLGKSYLGINGLFTNILSMLSLAELGVGNAIIFKLYDPIARDDHHRIAVLMKFYKTVYRWIGLVVAALGLLLIPFLPSLIKDYDKLASLNLNAALIFCLYLLQNVSSYLFFAYKSALLSANQKEYLINLISYFFLIGANILQIVCLYLFKSFELYVAIHIVQIIGQNFACAWMANKLYPYIKEETPEKLSSEEARGVFKDCSALFLYKVNGVVVKSTDNIILSKFLGLDMVAMYSNYYIFYTTLRTLFNKIFNSVSHSLGNLHTTHDVDHEFEIFNIVMFVAAILGGVSFVGISVVSDELIEAWIGKDWVLGRPFSILMGLELFTAPFKNALSRYRTTMGLFRQAKYRPVLGMVINLVVSIALVNVWGISGVLVGTIASDWLTFMWFDPLIVFRHGFQNRFSVWRYYGTFLMYFFAACVLLALNYLICSHILVGLGWISVIVHAVICGITVPTVMVLLYIRRPEGRYMLSYGKKFLRKLKR